MGLLNGRPDEFGPPSWRERWRDWRESGRVPLLLLLKVVFGFLLCGALTYAPLFASGWLRRHVARDTTFALLPIWVLVVQVLPPVLLWKRARPVAWGFLVYIGCELLLVIAMLLGIVHPV